MYRSQRDAKSLEIVGSQGSVAFFADGKHIVGSFWENRIRRLRVEDGAEVGTAMDVGDHIWDMAVSRDGKWVVSGTSSGLVTVWNAESHEKVSEFTGHERLWAVDVSPDGTKIATGSGELTACVWSLSGQRLLGPLQHNYSVAGVKFSSNGRLIATAARQSISGSVRIYDSHNGRLLIDAQIQPSPCNKQFFAWAADSKWLFILSCGAIINCLDVSTGTILSQWPIHTRDRPGCIAVAPNGRFIAASAAKSVSFWDTRTHKKIGSIIKHKTFVRSIAISNDDIATSASTTITLMRLGDILPSEYLDVMARDEEILSMGVQGTNPKDIIKLSPAHDGCSIALSRIQGEGVDLEETNQSVLAEIYDLRAQNESLHKVIATLENTVQELRTDLAVFKRNADQAIDSLCARNSNSEKKIARLEALTSGIQDVFTQFNNSHHTTD